MNPILSTDELEYIKHRPYFIIYPSKFDLMLDGKCTSCKKPIDKNDFINQEHVIEYTIMGACKLCQLEVQKRMEDFRVMMVS